MEKVYGMHAVRALLLRHAAALESADAERLCSRLWLNPEAKVPLPAGMAAALLRITGGILAE